MKYSFLFDFHIRTCSTVVSSPRTPAHFYRAGDTVEQEPCRDDLQSGYESFEIKGDRMGPAGEYRNLIFLSRGLRPPLFPE